MEGGRDVIFHFSKVSESVGMGWDGHVAFCDSNLIKFVPLQFHHFGAGQSVVTCTIVRSRGRGCQGTSARPQLFFAGD